MFPVTQELDFKYYFDDIRASVGYTNTHGRKIHMSIHTPGNDTMYSPS
jgi:hypothetical protein